MNENGLSEKDHALIFSCMDICSRIITSFITLKERPSAPIGSFINDVISNTIGNIIIVFTDFSKPENFEKNYNEVKNALDIWFKNAKENYVPPKKEIH